MLSSDMFEHCLRLLFVAVHTRWFICMGACTAARLYFIRPGTYHSFRSVYGS